MRKALIAVAALAAIGVSVYTLWPRKATVTPQMAERQRVCDKCGYRFDGPTTPILLECPSCHQRAGVRAYFRKCNKCGTVFEAFRERPVDTSLTKIDPNLPPPELEYKREGGNWVGSVQELGPIQCPKCGSTDLGEAPYTPTRKEPSR